MSPNNNVSNENISGKESRLLIASIIIMSLSFVVILLVYYDVINFNQDNKNNFFQKNYLVTQLVYKTINGKRFLLGTPYFFKLNGTVNLQSTSRSTQNPIHVTIKLIPYDVDTFSMASLWKVLPTTLHYVFPNAIDPKNSNSDVEQIQVIIPVSKINNTYQYEGEGTIQYQDAGDYDYYLQERSDSIKIYDNGTTKVNYSFNLNTETNQIRIGESNSTSKIHIESYSQTQNIISNKNNWYITFSAIIVGAIGNIIRLSKRISNKS